MVGLRIINITNTCEDYKVKLRRRKSVQQQSSLQSLMASNSNRIMHGQAMTIIN